jgi:hypothetical protein
MDALYSVLKPGDRVYNDRGKLGTVTEVGWDSDAGEQLYVTVHWDVYQPGIVGPARVEDLVLAENTRRRG